ncbi:putative RPN5-26S proteasome regulatory subunit [Tilletiopsis washingtonensis]|uniref:Putative RPN5-26S proteasome regulatory subunit n=1 Tax=Tilletiopsis washingtonensis TaxID=58919 RepID=A0A316Z1Q2_9BASI|nr:putative RPN5-26S proteasome regulatory subunit [Tilletiopsis washingtonensis]PWN95489.1 putative RPN5-26S proteasome regulatory subunit [Tilletiopsis washingtonensis]
MNAAEKKQEADLSPDVDALEPTARQLASSGKLPEALEKLNALEKKARNAADLTSTTRLLLLSILLIRISPSAKQTDWALLAETLGALARKHGQLKQAVTRMVQLAMRFLHAPGEPDVDEEMGELDPLDEPSEQEKAAKEKDEKKRKAGEEREIEDKGEGQLEPRVQKLMEEARAVGNEGVDEEQRMKLIESLRTVTEGKIFVEVERARVTRLLSSILYSRGDVAGATEALQELAVETFGSMGRREKTSFILEQMRLNLEKGDYTRCNIVSRKINTKFFDDSRNHDLKLTYYALMERYALHEKKHLDVCRYARAVLATPRIQRDEARAREVLRSVVVFLVLAPYDNEQSDLMARVEETEGLERVPEHKNLLKCFTTPELMRWPGIEALYGPLLRATPTFEPGTDGDYRWEELHKRVVEHNIRVIAKYYTKITLQRLSELLDLSPDAAEAALAKLVQGGTVYGKIDRPAGVVAFVKRRETAEHLNAWSADMGQLLALVEATSHLISREHAISKAGLVAPA